MENLQSVCFVGKIQEINNMEGADRIQQSVISGWECVIPKDKYKVGDLLVIAVTDAVIPIQLAENLGVLGYLKHRKKTNQYTVKTTKLKGIYSTAMIVEGNLVGNFKEGEDMMIPFEITKYEEPEQIIQLSSGRKLRVGKHEAFHVYHKFPNAKNAPGMFSPEDDVKITRKIHGCNARYGIVKKPKITIWDRIRKWFGNELAYYDYVYGSHQVEKGVNSVHYYDEDVWAKIGEKYDLEKRLKKVALHTMRDVTPNCPDKQLGEGLIIYGEIYGPGIQKYYDYGLKEVDFIAFDIKLGNEYQDNVWFNHYAQVLIGIPIIHPYYVGKFNEEVVKQWQYDRFIEGTKVPEEGCVVSSLDGNRQKICKYINPEYLAFQSKKEDSTDFH